MPAQDFTVEDILADGQASGASPDQIAGALQEWRSDYLDYGRSKETEPLEFWKKSATLDDDTTKALLAVRDSVGAKIISTLPPEQRKPFSERYAEVKGDPTQMINDEWISKAIEVNKLQDDPRYRIERLKPVTLDADGKPLADIMLKSSGPNEWEALVMPLKEDSKPFSLALPRYTSEQLQERSTQLESEIGTLEEKRLANATASETAGEGGSISPMIDQGLREKQQELETIQAGPRALALRDAEKAIKADHIDKVADKSLLDRFVSGAITASINTARAGAMLLKDKDPFPQFEEGMAQLNKDTARSVLPTTGEQILSSAAESAGQMAATILPAGVGVKAAGAAATELGMAATMAPSGAGGEWASMLKMADEIGGEEGDRIRSVAKWSALAQAAIDTGTEVMFPEMAGAFKGGTLKNVVTAPLKEGAEEVAAGLLERGVKQPAFYPQERQQPLLEGTLVEAGAGALAAAPLGLARLRRTAKAVAPDPGTAAVIDRVVDQAEDWATLNTSAGAGTPLIVSDAQVSEVGVGVSPASDDPLSAGTAASPQGAQGEEAAVTVPSASEEAPAPLIASEGSGDQGSAAPGVTEDLPAPLSTEESVESISDNATTSSSPEGTPLEEPAAEGVPLSPPAEQVVEGGPAELPNSEQDVQPTGSSVEAQRVERSDDGSQYSLTAQPTLTPLTEPQAMRVAMRVFGGRHPANLSYISDPNARTPQGYLWAGVADRQSQRIIINLAGIHSEADLKQKVEEEALHLVYLDPEVQKAVATLEGVITPAMLRDVAKLGYSELEQPEEAVVRLIQRLTENPDTRGLMQRIYDAIKAAFRRIFRMEPNRQQLESAARSILKAAVSERESFKGEGVRYSLAQVFGQQTDQPTAGDSYKAAREEARKFFDGDQPISAAATADAFEKATGWTEDTLKQFGSPAEVGQAQVHLYRYAARLAEAGDPSLLNHILTNATKWAQTTEGKPMTIGEIAALLGSRSFPQSATLQAAAATGVTRRAAEGKELGEEFIEEVDTAVRKTKLDEPVVRKVKRGAKSAEGKTLEEKVLAILKGGTLKPLEDALINAPAPQQQNPTWRQNLAVSYFKQLGLSPQQAAAAARLYNKEFAERLNDALQGAIEKVAKSKAPWAAPDLSTATRKKKLTDLEKLRRAVRLGVTDPNSEWHAELAKQNGWKGFTPDQFTRLAEIDAQLEDESVPAYKKKELQAEIADIVQRAGLPPTLTELITASYVMSALSGLPTLNVQFSGPISLLTPFLGDIATNPVTAARAMMAASKTWVASLIHSAKTNTYQHQVGEHLRDSQPALEHLMEAGIKDWQAGKHAKGLSKILVGAQQYLGRAYSSMDEGTIAAHEIYKTTVFGKRELKRLGMSEKDASDVIAAAFEAKTEAYDQARNAGLKHSEAIIASNEIFRNRINGNFDDAFAKGVTADSMGPVGRIAEGLSNYDEGFLRTPMNWFLESLHGAYRKGGRHALLARLAFGFVSIPFRSAMNFSNFMPYGFLRYALHRKYVREGKPSPWQQSYTTKAQERQRLRDAIIGTAMMAIVAKIAGGSDDDDPNKSEFKIVVTGFGPRDPALRKLWLQRFQPYSLNLKVGKTYSQMNLGRAFESIAWPMALAGALDDVDLAHKRKGTRRFDAGMELFGSYAGSLMQRASFQSLGKLSGEMYHEGASKAGQELGRQAVFAVGAFIPWKGAMASATRLMSEPIDQSTMQGVVLGNTPVIGPIFGKPALNVLGDPVSDGNVAGKLYREGLPIVVRFPTGSADRKVYDLIMLQGKGPSVVQRGAIEETYGLIDEKQFYDYRRVRGQMIKEKMLERADRLRGLDSEKYGEALEKISREVNPKAARAVGLKKVKR